MLICLGICGVHFAPNAFWQAHQETMLIDIRCFMGKLLRSLTSAMIISQAQDWSALLYGRKFWTFTPAAVFTLDHTQTYSSGKHQFSPHAIFMQMLSFSALCHP